MNSRQRLENCISGNDVDRAPVSLWRHFPVDDLHPDTLARSVVLFQEIYQFDFVKITPASSFCVKDWGAKDKWDGNPEGSYAYAQFPVKNPEDWKKIQCFSPRQGALGAQLECIKLIRESLPATTPVIQTIFSPLAQAKNLIGKENLLHHLQHYPNELKIALNTITEQTILFINECKKLNIDGIFYAVQHAQQDLLSENEFRSFEMINDLEILSYVQDLWLNVGHIHGSKIMFDLVAEYPVQILNWHDREEPISLAEGKTRFKGAVCGGLRQWDTMAFGTPDQVTSEAKDALLQTSGSRFVLGTGCVLPIIAPHSNILAAIDAVRTVE